MERPKILIVDDDVNMSKTLSDILSAKGYETIAAKNGTEGLDLLKQNYYNLALIDLQLPDISGLEILNRVKSDHPSTEAIILTGNATLDSAIEATNKGAFSYLQKPYEIDQLMLHIGRALEKQQTDKKIIEQNTELQKTNSELNALYAVSRAIGQTIEMDDLLPRVLHALIAMDTLRVQCKGVMFLVEGDRMRLVSHIGLSEAALEHCNNMVVGNCLCGLAAAKGEIVVSNDSHRDGRHTIQYTGMNPHGHIIVPLKAANAVVGVLCLYTQPDVVVGERVSNLLFSIGNQIGIAVENAKLYEKAKSSSLQDPLTGLANRRSLQSQLGKSFESAKRTGGPLSIIMLDIDYFKQYNDTHGHIEGDGMLVQIAHILLKAVRAADSVFRYGGEEFLVLLPATDLTNACKTADRLRKAVESEAGITISLGVSAYDESLRSKDELINKADNALYQAKQNGRNRVEAGERG